MILKINIDIFILIKKYTGRKEKKRNEGRKIWVKKISEEKCIHKIKPNIR